MTTSIFDQTLRVPVVKSPKAVSADDPGLKLKERMNSAFDARVEKDERLSAALQRTKARLHFINFFRDADNDGEDGDGFVVRAGDTFKKYKAEAEANAMSPRARELMNLGSLQDEVLARAAEREASARLHDRLQRIGKMIDDLVDAATSSPLDFVHFHETGRAALEGLKLTPKLAAAFKSRLNEIPQAALSALAQQDPPAAIEMVKKRAGAADPKYGVPRNIVRLAGKQAEAEQRDRETKAASDEAVLGSRVLIDGKTAIAAVKRGEAPPSALAGWIAHKDAIGKPTARQLQRESDEAQAQVSARSKAAKAVRERLGRGETIDHDDPRQVDGLDDHYANEILPLRQQASADDEAQNQQGIQFAKLAGALPLKFAERIVAQFKSDSMANVASAAAQIEALERVDPALTRRLPPDVVDEAHRIIDAVHGGAAWKAAAESVRTAKDMPREERARREQTLARVLTGDRVKQLIEDIFPVNVKGVSSEAGPIYNEHQLPADNPPRPQQPYVPHPPAPGDRELDRIPEAQGGPKDDFHSTSAVGLSDPPGLALQPFDPNAGYFERLHRRAADLQRQGLLPSRGTDIDGRPYDALVRVGSDKGSLRISGLTPRGVDVVMQMLADDVQRFETVDEAVQFLITAYAKVGKRLSPQELSELRRNLSPARALVVGIAVKGNPADRRQTIIVIGENLRRYRNANSPEPAEAQDAKVLAHELGHIVSRVMKLGERFSALAAGERLQIGRELEGVFRSQRGNPSSTETDAKNPEEWIAEFFMLYLVAPEAAKRVAPLAAAIMRKWWNETPNVNRTLILSQDETDDGRLA